MAEQLQENETQQGDLNVEQPVNQKTAFKEQLNSGEDNLQSSEIKYLESQRIDQLDPNSKNQQVQADDQEKEGAFDKKDRRDEKELLSAKEDQIDSKKSVRLVHHDDPQHWEEVKAEVKTEEKGNQMQVQNEEQQELQIESPIPEENGKIETNLREVQVSKDLEEDLTKRENDDVDGRNEVQNDEKKQEKEDDKQIVIAKKKSDEREEEDFNKMENEKARQDSIFKQNHQKKNSNLRISEKINQVTTNQKRNSLNQEEEEQLNGEHKELKLINQPHQKVQEKIKKEKEFVDKFEQSAINQEEDVNKSDIGELENLMENMNETVNKQEFVKILKINNFLTKQNEEMQKMIEEKDNVIRQEKLIRNFLVSYKRNQ